MKNTNVFRLFGIIAFVVIIDFSFFACEDFSNEETSGGTFTLTNIPSEYEGKFAGLWADGLSVDSEIYGSYTDPSEGIHYTPIINGVVKIPLYEKSTNKKYIGDGNKSVGVDIYNSDIPDTDNNKAIDYWRSSIRITFSKGSANASW
jgi:hypothetical protein